MALEDLFIQSKREAKIKYPFKDLPYDPDGQKYDVLGGMDLSKIIWIECKKPIYLSTSKDPLANIVNREKIEKFYKRALFLHPDIAIYLVDTKNNYLDKLKNDVFADEFFDSGCYFELKSPYCNVLLRLHGFIYFIRLDYTDNKDYFQSLKDSISQVLHDARKNWPGIYTSGLVFR